MIERVRVGCPVWGRKDWVGELFASGTRTGDYLSEYVRVFNAVEGNTTFYATPSEDIARRWAAQARGDFRFCFKLPRGVTHDRLLLRARREVEAFLTRMAVIGDRLGPFMIQLPAAFGPERLGALEDFLVALPGEFRFAVEVRHVALHEGPAADELDRLLAELGVDRVILDTRGLHARAPIDAHHAASQRRKPALPLRPSVTGRNPIVRIVADPEPAQSEGIVWGWAKRVATWIEQGLTPYVFLHCPDDFHAPRLARTFFGMLRARVDVGEMPPWPADAEREDADADSKQIELF